ncbi:MAG TPA: MarR family transcriptional regulator, partial [Candidatus Competibacteraceae bacterium]|nr:MarR family transcriptional regulator [Candidatus Competibacteraceae bacterium]
LYLTPQAHPLLEQIWRLGAEIREEALNGISAADREQLIAILLTMKANLIQTSVSAVDSAQQ